MSAYMNKPLIPGYRKAELAGAAQVSMPTVAKFLRGGRLLPTTEKALNEAAKRIGLDVQPFRESLGVSK